MDFKDKYCLESEKTKESNRDKTPLLDKDFELILALNKLNENLERLCLK